MQVKQINCTSACCVIGPQFLMQQHNVSWCQWDDPFSIIATAGLTKAVVSKQVLLKGMQIIMPALHGKSSPACELWFSDSNCYTCVACCCSVQAANADTWGQGEVLVKLCVTHANVCGAWPNLSPHIAQVFMQLIKLCQSNTEEQRQYCLAVNAILPRVSWTFHCQHRMATRMSFLCTNHQQNAVPNDAAYY